MISPIRFGILSFAHYHANFWAQAIVSDPDAVLAGVWDDNDERGRAAAARYDTRFWSDLPALLAACDAVGVTSETANHAPLIEAAAAAGVHILCEKPVAASLADCARIERAVTTAGVSIMQNFPKRFDPINQELVDLVRGGTLGEVSLVRIRHGHHHGLDPAFVAQWYADPALSGGGTLVDEGIHAADMLRWLLGDPDTVQASLSAARLRLPVEDTAVATFTFPSGVIAEVATSWTFTAADQSVEVYGTGGSALLSGVDLASRDLAAPPYLRLARHGVAERTWLGSPTIPGFIAGGFHEQGPRRFVRHLRAGEPPAVGLNEARGALAMILAAYRAAETGVRQPIGDGSGQA